MIGYRGALRYTREPDVFKLELDAVRRVWDAGHANFHVMLPFVRTARPYIRNLQPAAENLHKASPDLRKSFFELNRLFNMLSFNPGGHEELDSSGTPEAHIANRQRDEGFLFWLAWTAQNTTSLFSTSDASGPYRRIVAGMTCSALLAAVKQEPANELILGVSDVLNTPGLCPAE